MTTTLIHHQREKSKEKLLHFLKTLPSLVEDNQFDAVILRLENCRLLVVEIVAMKLNEKMANK